MSESQNVNFSVLFTQQNDGGTFTHVFRDFIGDVTLLLSDSCVNDGCNCMGCEIYADRARIDGEENLDLRPVNERTVMLNLSEGETEWNSEIIKNNSVDWSDWEDEFLVEYS